MSNPWDTELQVTSSDAAGLAASARVATGSPFFDGHFPGHPVVPGIAMLSMVEAAVARGWPGLVVSGFRRVRFRQAVESGGEFDVSLKESPRFPGQRLLFEVRFGGERACDGQVTVRAGEAS